MGVLITLTVYEKLWCFVLAFYPCKTSDHSSEGVAPSETSYVSGPSRQSSCYPHICFYDPKLAFYHPALQLFLCLMRYTNTAASVLR